jgi:hypothetical protein
MAEAPSGWTRVRNAILKGMKAAQAEVKEGVCGYSEPWHIEHALLEAGLLTPEAEEVIGFIGVPPDPKV